MTIPNDFHFVKTKTCNFVSLYVLHVLCEISWVKINYTTSTPCIDQFESNVLSMLHTFHYNNDILLFFKGSSVKLEVQQRFCKEDVLYLFVKIN